MRKRLALGISIPAVVLFVGILVALLAPSNRFVLIEALDALGLLGGRRRLEGLVAAPPGPAPPAPLWIVNGTLWDALGGVRPNPGLAVSGGRIGVRPEPGARIIDASGLTILPGLIDMHVHALGGRFADEMMIGNGVTSARDLGSPLAGVLRHRRESASGGRVGPRLFITGPYLVGAEATSDQEAGVSGQDAAVALVEKLAAAGVDGIKVHWGLGAATLRGVVRAAHGRGLWVAAHLDRVGAAEAARLGVDTIEHATGLRWDDPPAAAAREEAIAAMVARGVALTPTLVVAEHAFTLPELAVADRPVLSYFPRLLRRWWVSGQIANAAAADLTPSETARRRRRLQRLERFVERFHAAGGRVLAGSDAPAFLVAPGFGLHRELELLVEAGLPPAEALGAATHEAARALGRAAEIGDLAPGMRADLILVAGDPLSRAGIGATRNIVLVVRDGHVLVDRLD